MNNKLLLVGIAVIVIVVIAGGLLFFNSKQTPSNSSNTTPTETATEESTKPTAEPSQEAMTKTEVVRIELTSSGFSPKDIEVVKGTKVLWTNNSGKAATVDSTPHPVHTDYPKLNLGSFNDGQTLELVFNDLGTFKYHNHFNSSQNGSVTVK